MADVTTGQELNSYTGNTALAGDGNELGQASSDFTPLANFALKSFEVNKLNYEREEEDRKALEKQFEDPNIRLPLDKIYADQIAGDLDELAGMLKKKPWLNQDREQIYQFKEKYNKILNDNAVLKSVQAQKEKYSGLAGQERDEIKKANYDKYLKKLEGYKLGDKVPVFEESFAFSKDHLPSLVTSKMTKQIPNGNNIDTIEETTVNPLNADKLAKDQAAKDAKVRASGEALAKGVFNHGDISYYNDLMKKAYADGFQLNYDSLKEKYKPEFEAYSKANPSVKTFEQFLHATGKDPEVKAITDGLQFLKNGLQYIPGDVADGGGKLPGFTYDESGAHPNMRLNVDDDTLRGIFAAIEGTVGKKTKVVSSELSKLPSEIRQNEAQARKMASDAAANMIKAKSYSALQGAKIKEVAAKIKKMDGTQATQYMDEIWDRQLVKEKEDLPTKLPAGNALPVMTIKNDKSTMLQPKGAIPIYDKYKSASKKGGDRVPDDGAKIIKYDYSKAYWDVEYTGPDGTVIPPKQIQDDYNAFINTTEYKDAAARSGKSITLKQYKDLGIKNKKYDYVLRGEASDGSTGTGDRKLNASAQMIINNSASSDKEDNVFEPEPGNH